MEMVENKPFISFVFQVKWFGGFVIRQVFCSVGVYVCKGMSVKNFTSLLPSVLSPGLLGMMSSYGQLCNICVV